MFRYRNNNIVNEKGRVIEVNPSNRDPEDYAGASLRVSKLNNDLSQQWDVVYTDEMPPEPKKGDMFKDFNLVIDRPFFIVSALPDGRYIDVLSNNMVIKTRNGFDSQQWYFDYASRTIKNMKTKSHSINIQNNGKGTNMEIRNTNSASYQMFKFDGAYLISIKDNNVIQVPGDKDEEGQSVTIGAKTKSVGQRWKIVFVDEAPKEATEGMNKDFGLMINKPFYIVSAMHMHRVMDASSLPNIRMKRIDPSRGNKGQLFMFDGQTKTLKNVQHTSHSITIQSSGNNSGIRMETTNARWFQMFKFENHNIVNEKGKIIEVQGHVDNENQPVVMANKPGSKAQLEEGTELTAEHPLFQEWNVIYADAMPAEPKKGEINKDYGLFVERPFHIVTHLSSERFIDLVGNNMVMKTPNGFKSQLWWFDQATYTIRSEGGQRYAFWLNGSNMIMRNANKGGPQKESLFKYDASAQTFVHVYTDVVLDVQGGTDREGQSVGASEYKKGNKSQQFKVVYADTVKAAPTKGLNEDFGFHVNRPFYIVSRLWMNRVIQQTGNGGHLRLRTMNRNEVNQRFVFDGSSKTIKSVRSKELSVAIQSQGRSPNMILQPTTARWF